VAYECADPVICAITRNKLERLKEALTAEPAVHLINELVGGAEGIRTDGHRGRGEIRTFPLLNSHCSRPVLSG
jgi:hypothetical protein